MKHAPEIMNEVCDMNWDLSRETFALEGIELKQRI